MINRKIILDRSKLPWEFFLVFAIKRIYDILFTADICNNQKIKRLCK